MHLSLYIYTYIILYMVVCTCCIMRSLKSWQLITMWQKMKTLSIIHFMLWDNSWEHLSNHVDGSGKQKWLIHMEFTLTYLCVFYVGEYAFVFVCVHFFVSFDVGVYVWIFAYFCVCICKGVPVCIFMHAISVLCARVCAQYWYRFYTGIQQFSI